VQEIFYLKPKITMHSFSRTTGISVVVANMVGTGVFTSLGFQLLGIQSPFVLMMLWFVGGFTTPVPVLSLAGYQLPWGLPRQWHWLP
jgi:APA family basic amino acid/polyamine antiporter